MYILLKRQLLFEQDYSIIVFIYVLFYCANCFCSYILMEYRKMSILCTKTNFMEIKVQ